VANSMMKNPFLAAIGDKRVWQASEGQDMYVYMYCTEAIYIKKEIHSGNVGQDSQITGVVTQSFHSQGICLCAIFILKKVKIC